MEISEIRRYLIDVQLEFSEISEKDNKLKFARKHNAVLDIDGKLNFQLNKLLDNDLIGEELIEVTNKIFPIENIKTIPSFGLYKYRGQQTDLLIIV